MGSLFGSFFLDILMSLPILSAMWWVYNIVVYINKVVNCEHEMHFFFALLMWNIWKIILFIVCALAWHWPTLLATVIRTFLILRPQCTFTKLVIVLNVHAIFVVVNGQFRFFGCLILDYFIIENQTARFLRWLGNFLCLLRKKAKYAYRRVKLLFIDNNEWWFD